MAYKLPCMQRSVFAESGGYCRRQNFKYIIPKAKSREVLSSTQPIDRLRYQAKVVFQHFDRDGDGKLNDAEFQEYVKHSSTCLGALPKSHDLRQQINKNASMQGLDYDKFEELFRIEVQEASNHNALLSSVLSSTEVAKLQYSSSLTINELAKVMAVFKLLDFDGDKKLSLSDLKSVEGIEKTIIESTLVDTAEEKGGCLQFEDFLTSYAKERPVVLALMIMAAHTLTMFCIFNLPIDIMYKVILCAAVILKPQIITNPVIKLYNIVKALVGGMQAKNEVSSQFIYR